MSFKVTALVLHGVAAGIMLWGYTSLIQMPGLEWIHLQKGGFFQYLTIQGILVAWLTMMFSIACDVLPSVTIFKNVKRSLLMVAMPIAVVVSAMYWLLYLFRPVLITPVVPATVEPPVGALPNNLRAPFRVDLALHAVPTITLFLDFFFFEKRYSNKEASFGAPTATLLSSIWYISCVEYLAAVNGNFAYPFLDTNVEARAIKYVGATMLALISFWTLNRVHS